MDNTVGVTKTGTKGISSTQYAEEAERKEKKQGDGKNKARFSIFLGEGF